SDMRSRFAHAAVFIGVFCLFLGYCEWWKSRPEMLPEMNAWAPPHHGAYVVEGAADETFNGVYLPMPSHEEVPCFIKQGPPRFLWRSPSRWHLSTEPAMIADGYMSEIEGSASSEWVPDGAPGPAPSVSRLPEFAESQTPLLPAQH
ncbi:MAG: hypothetical protein ACOCX2_04405, partial [Armatimonadota bacterium]